MKPAIKRVGGKTKLLPGLKKRLPEKFNKYYEPFVGGGALFLELDHQPSIISDLDADLITCYDALAHEVGAVLRHLTTHKIANQRYSEYFYQVRDQWNKGWYATKSELAAAYIFLCQTGFNGLWRVNKAGDYNVPKGSYKDPKIFDEDHLRSLSKRFQAATLRIGDYQATTEDAEPGDFVYVDPPYAPLNSTSNFVGYTSTGFNNDAQATLANWAWWMKEKGVLLMLSNSDIPLIRHLYRDFNIQAVIAPRRVGAKAASRASVSELIITSY